MSVVVHGGFLWRGCQTFCYLIWEGIAVPESVLDAIRQGQWDFEPVEVESDDYNSTLALPGSDAKIDTLAERAKQGLPLWHPEDRRSYDDSEEAMV